MRLIFSAVVLACLCGRTAGQPVAVKVDESNDPESGLQDPSIAFDAKDPTKLVMGTSKGTIYYSQDGGRSWTGSPREVWYDVGSDIQVFSKGKDEFLCFYICEKNFETGGTANYPVVARSINAGKNWTSTEPVVPDFTNPAADLHVFSSRRGGTFLTWTQLGNPGDTACRSGVVITQSGNAKSWDRPVSISKLPGSCDAGEGMLRYAAAVESPDGRIMVAWLNGTTIYLDRSFDNGRFWLNNDIEATHIQGASFHVPGAGERAIQPVFRIDNSAGSYKGSLYLAWSNPEPSGDGVRLRFLRSLNYGDYWGSAETIFPGTNKEYQFMPAMTVDESTGYVYIIYYKLDDRGAGVHLAWSIDGGNHFKDMTLSAESFQIDEDLPLGNHPAILASQGTIAVAWIEHEDGKAVLFSSVVQQDQVIKK